MKNATETLIAFDETGNTGANLLDPDQPIFVLASVNLSKEQALSVLGNGESEGKFSKLKRSSGGRRKLIETLNSPLLSEDRVLVMAIHKSFMITAKMVDMLLEPLVHADGLDLYEKGANIALANMLHFCLPVFLGNEAFNRLQASFVEMVRTPSTASIYTFYSLVDDLYAKHRDAEFADDLAMLVASESVAREDSHLWGPQHLDPAIPAFVTHAGTWTERLGENVHNHSRSVEAPRKPTDHPAGNDVYY